jgi:steroid 5-alpha reductase family enzyme
MGGPETLARLTGWVFVAMLAVLAAAWLVQRAARNSGWVDVFWTFGTGGACAAAAAWPLAGDQIFAPRALMTAAMAGAWGLRLGLYISRRVGGSAEDARYAQFRRDWSDRYELRLLLLLTMQPPVSAVLALAVALAARAPGPWPGARDAAAVFVWLAAICGEALADGQMARFKADPANRGAICDQGLWSWSRHPNYFFEQLGWWAYPVLAIRPEAPVNWLSLGAPVVMYLILRFGSGVPPLERSMLASRGDAFRAYQARTSAFVPLPPRRDPDASNPVVPS